MYDPQQKKKDILMAALEIFGRDGFYKAKVSDIAKQADVGKGTIYEYFDSKKNLFEEMVDFCGYKGLEYLTEEINKEESAIEKLKKYILIESQVMEEYGDIIYVFIQDSNKLGDNVKSILMDYRQKKIEIMKDVLQEGIEVGAFKEISLEVTALSFMGAIHHLLFNRKIFGSPKEIEDIIQDFLEIFINGIKK